MEDWLPLIVTIAAALLGAIAYTVQRHIDRRHSLIELRRQEYIGFLESILTAPNSKEALDEFNTRRIRLTVIASDPVLAALKEFSDYAARTSAPDVERQMDTFKKLLAELIISMRRDCFDRTRLDAEGVRFALPIQD